MRNQRYEQLAGLLVGYSTRVSAGDVVILEMIDVPTDMTLALVSAVRRRGGIPVVWLKSYTVLRELQLTADTASMQLLGELELEQMKRAQCYIAIRGGANVFELSDVPPEQGRLYAEHWLKLVHLEQRVNHTRWVITRWPGSGMAQQAGRSTEAFEDFYFDVCLVDYARMARAAEPLAALINRTNTVHIVAPGTNLRFSIAGLGAVPCTGSRNVPDGEVFTAPVKGSINGIVRFNTPTNYQGVPYRNVTLTFENGRIVRATSDMNQERLEALLNTDEGSRFIGEFAIAFNPKITEAMGDILFDEKIRGSLHLAIGNAYKGVADNGNVSAVHFDLVQIQRPEHGGGSIYFDDVLIRQDGLFVLPELLGLNPENLERAE